jgi:hypothetical protein
VKLPDRDGKTQHTNLGQPGNYMTGLTRRRSPQDSNCWHIYFGDVRVGTVVRAIGTPNHAELWQWYCGFYPGSQPCENTSGTAETFDQARKAFEAAWRVFLASRTEEDFAAWRYDRDLTAWMYAMRDAGLKLPTQTQDGFARCFCGADVNNADIRSHILASHKRES